MRFGGEIAAGTMELGLVIGTVSLSAQKAKTQWDGVYNADQAKRGRAVYQDICAVCHSSNLYGTELAPSLRGAALTPRWGNRPLADLLDYIQLFMPLNSPDGLTRQQNADILAFIL